jgi:hypothetical protein
MKLLQAAKRAGTTTRRKDLRQTIHRSTIAAECGRPGGGQGLPNANSVLNEFSRFCFRDIIHTASLYRGNSMKYKTKLLVDRFTKTLSQWPGLECVSLNEAAIPDTLDPYFALILDVFYSGPIPEADERCRLYGGDVAAFETSGQNIKDRFLIGDIPVRLEYKATGKIEELVSIADTKLDSLWLIKDSGTYGFYRLVNGEILFSRSGWIAEIRKRLENVGDVFWREMRYTSQSKMEHFLSDLGAAYFQGDDFHYLIASAGFCKAACLTLFCINRRFEPSHRAYYKQVTGLPELPESFPAQLETFLRNDPDTTMERRYSLAQVIARGVVAL